jgi:hypothetical protein
MWEVERQHHLEPGSTAAPRSWVTSSEIEKFPEDQLPAIIVASPGLTDPPLADGEGSYTARFEIDVAVHIATAGNRIALTLARHYAAAIRACLIQQQRLGDLVAVQRIDWIDERYDRLPSVDDRTICAGRVGFAIEVSDVTRRHHGPLDPFLGPDSEPPPTPPSWEPAHSVTAHIDKRPPGEPVTPEEEP